MYKTKKYDTQKNKLPNNFLKNFNGIFKKIVTIEIPSEPNSCSADQLKVIALKQKYEVETASNFKEALRKITSNKPKVICFMGSLYLIGSVLKEN